MTNMTFAVTYYQHLVDSGCDKETAAKVVTSLGLEIDTRIDSKFKAFEAKLDAIETKFEAKFDAIDIKFDAIETKFDAKFDALGSKITTMQWMMGVMFTLLVLINAGSFLFKH